MFTKEMLARALRNPILNTDSYKPSHWLQYPPNTEIIYDYIESRGGKFDQTVFFGLQMFVKEFLSRQITQQDIDDAEVFLTAHGEPFNREGWEYILNNHDGYMPIRIRAIPEGMVITTRNIMVSVENIDENPLTSWVVSYIETALLRAIWYTTTVATTSWHIKGIIGEYLKETADDDALVELYFKLHDFGARGVSSFESAGLSGAAHLVNFMGTDTITGILYSMLYYNESEMTAFSIPAAEHSSITTWGRKGEFDAYSNMLKQFGGKYPLMAVVSDSYNIFDAVEKGWGGALKDEVLGSGSMLVIRPDSGDPATVVCKIANILDATFGSEINTKGYKVLKGVRIIQGDGVDENSIRDILAALRGYNFSATNVAFGMGGALLQKVNRDTQKFAMKTSWAQIDGESVDVFKDPVTDSGKRSKKGRLDLYQDSNGEFYTGHEGQPGGLLEDVWECGKLLRDHTFTEIRANSEKLPEDWLAESKQAA